LQSPRQPVGRLLKQRTTVDTPSASVVAGVIALVAARLVSVAASTQSRTVEWFLIQGDPPTAASNIGI
jgi:putative intracellular protease/amidase